MKKVLLSAFLVCVSTAVALLLLEGLLRLFLNPVDYLKPALMADPVLGHRIVPGSAWHDAWGFRNRSVPQSVDIVAIGDSMTYGNQALAKDAWPNRLARLTGRTTYNMGLGGYGPLQYWYLMANKAVKLRPKIIIVGLYIGNDIMDSYNMATNYKAWKPFRDGSTDNALPVEETARSGVKFVSGDTGWLIQFLMRRSIFFRLLLDSPAGEWMHQARNLLHGLNLGIVNFGDDGGGDGNIVYLDIHGKSVAVQNGYVLPAVDLDTPNIASGLAITTRVLGLMRRFCAERGISLVVVLIPTKDTVLAEAMPPARSTTQYSRTVEQEARIRTLLQGACIREGIPCLDLLPDLRANLKIGMPYHVDTENHPSKEGYYTIAASIARFLSVIVPEWGRLTIQEQQVGNIPLSCNSPLESFCQNGLSWLHRL